MVMSFLGSKVYRLGRSPPCFCHPVGLLTTSRPDGLAKTYCGGLICQVNCAASRNCSHVEQFEGGSCTGVLVICCIVIATNAPSAGHPAAETPSNSSSPLQPVSALPEPVDRWSIHQETNELDGTRKLSVSSSDVVIRCAPKVEGYIIPTLTNLGHMLKTDVDHGQTVRYRLDGGPVRRGYWSISDSFDVLFMPRSVLHDLSGAQKLTVEYSPEYTTPETESFDLAGLAAAATKAGCRI